MTTPKPNFNIDTLYLARRDELSEGGRYGYLRAQADMQPRVDALVAALQEIEEDANSAQGSWAAVTETYAPEWTHPYKRIADRVSAALKREGKE